MVVFPFAVASMEHTCLPYRRRLALLLLRGPKRDGVFIQRKVFISALTLDVTSINKIQCATFSVCNSHEDDSDSVVGAKTTDGCCNLDLVTKPCVQSHGSMNFNRPVQGKRPCTSKEAFVRKMWELGASVTFSTDFRCIHSFQNTVDSVQDKSIFVILLLLICDDALLGCPFFSLGGHEASLDGLPINDTPNVLDIIRSHIAVIDIIRVFPNIL